MQYHLRTVSEHKMQNYAMSKVSRTLTQGLLLFLCSYIIIAVKANDGYLVTHPMMFRPNIEERLSVTIFDPTEEIKVQARLLWKDEVVAETKKYIFGKDFLTLQVPGYLYGRGIVEVCGNCEIGTTGFHFKNSTTVDISDKSSSVFIQIDKPVYKPGQDVHIHFIMTGPDLRPQDEKMVAYILDPQGSRMVQWKNLKAVCCGIMNVSFPLSDQPVLGDWTIFAEVQTLTYNKTFEVKKYVLPRFEVLIEPPSFIKDISTCEPATVTARYTYGKPVQGKLSINMNLHGLGYYDNYIGQNNYMFMDIHGTASFNICIGNLLSSMLKTHFRGFVRIEASVTSNDGNAFTAIDESCFVHEKLVALKFSKDTKKHYKPGLPFFGKAELEYPDGSPADDISVRVRAEINEEIAFSQDYLSSDGIVEFDIPSLPVGAGLVWLNAKVLAINSVDVSDTYVYTYESLGRWYSPSNCHILLRNLQSDLKVGDSAMIGIMSTCPCNFTYHYEVMSRGNILTSGSHRAVHSYNRNKRNLDPLAEVLIWDDVMHKNSTIPAPRDHCEAVFTFEVTHAMMPLSRVLVYYIMDNDEGIADSLTLPVEPSFENQVKVRLTRNKTAPGNKLSMAITAKPGSCICLAAVDRSVQLLKPGYQLTPEKIFQEMGKYDISAAVREETSWWHTGLRKRRRRSSLQRTIKSRDALYAFKDAGLKVMTDKVHLVFPEQDLSAKGGLRMEQDMPGSNQVVYHLGQHRRAYFPDTWMWQCFNLSETRKEEHVHIHTPDTITTWVMDVLAFSTTHGLGVAEPVSLTAFKELFVEFMLPYSVIRGEQLRVPVTVHNYMKECVQVSLTVHLQEGVRFLGEQSRSHAQKLCLQAGQVISTQVVLVFSQLGKKKIHAGVDAYFSLSCCDGPISGEESSIANDKITQSLLVEAEGIPRNYAYSVFFCPNEHIHISTPNKYEYQFVKKPSSMEFLTFMCKAKNDATIGLAPNPDAHELYEIVLGGWDNSMSWIARNRMGDQLSMNSTQDILSWDEFRAFWITWNDGEITVGYGEVPTNTSVILTWLDDSPLPVDYIGFSTGMGSIGEFRIWRKDDDDKTYSEAFTLTLPLNYVPGSERAVATIIGDVMGPTLNNLHNLIHLPFGCGEQNMIHFAPIVYVIGYLQRTNQLNTETSTEAKTFLVQGYQRQLTYKRQGGSYSAFGESDSSGNMWLTAFVLKSFAQSRAFIYIDPKELEESKAWIIAHQEVDGSFPPIGRVLNKDIQGGIQGKVSLTAYILVALLEAGLETMEEERAVIDAQHFLEDLIGSVTDPYTAALVAYALTVQSSISAQFAVKILSNMAISKEGLTYWRLSGEPLETLPIYIMDASIEQTVTSAEVEMTAYALLTFTAMGDIAYSLPIVKWLTQQRNSLGGFSSTQDTCVALQALSEYATLAYVGHVNLNISLAYSDTTGLVEEYYHLNNENSQVLQVIEVPFLSKTLFLGAHGEGCGLMQIDVNYNIPDPSNKPSFKLNVNLIEEEDVLAEIFPPGRKRRGLASGVDISNETPRNNEYKVVIETCTRWLHVGSSNMAVVEISLLSGFTAGVESLERLLLNKHSKVKRYELSGRKVILYFDEIPSQCMSCIRFDAYREHAVGKLSSVPVKVYDYYEPHFEATKFYNVSRESPLSGELCEEDRECNQVEDQDRAFEYVLQPDALHKDLDQCNSLDGDCITPADMVQCVCERTCQYGGSKVCGSDGMVYENYCLLEVAACQRNTNIRAMPINYCPEPVVTTMEIPLEDGSGALWPNWPVWSLSTPDNMVQTVTPQPPTQASPVADYLDIIKLRKHDTDTLHNVPTLLPQMLMTSTVVVAKNEPNIDSVETQNVDGLATDPQDDSKDVGNNQDGVTDTPLAPAMIQQFLDRLLITEDDTSIVNMSIPNINTSPQTKTVHEQQPEQEHLRDNPRTETMVDISHAAIRESQMETDTMEQTQNEKVTSANANAWPDALHDGIVHGNFENEVINVEEPTDLTNHATGTVEEQAMETEVLPTKVINKVIQQDASNLTQDVSQNNMKIAKDHIGLSSRNQPAADQVLYYENRGGLPVEPSGVNQNLHYPDHVNFDISSNQTQRQSKDQDFAAQQQEHYQTYLQDSEEKEQPHQQEIRLTEQPNLQEDIEQTQHVHTQEIQVIPSENMPLPSQQLIETLEKVENTEDLEKEYVLQITTNTTKRIQEDEHNLAENVDTIGKTAYYQHNKENPIKPAEAAQHKQNAVTQGTIIPTKIATTPITEWESISNDTSSSNQSNAEVKPYNQMEIKWKTNNSTVSNQSTSNNKRSNQTSDWKTTHLKTQPIDGVSENISSAFPSTDAHADKSQPISALYGRGTSSPGQRIEQSDTGHRDLEVDDEQENNEEEWPLKDLDPMVNDQGIVEMGIVDGIDKVKAVIDGIASER